MQRTARRARGPIGVILLATAVVAVPSSIESARWWRSPRTATVLRLTAPQQRAIDRIHSRMTAESAACAVRALRAQAHADRLLAAGASDWDLDAAAVALADAESATRRARTVGLYEMYRVLTARQRRAQVGLTPAHGLGRPE